MTVSRPHTGLVKDPPLHYSILGVPLSQHSMPWLIIAGFPRVTPLDWEHVEGSRRRQCPNTELALEWASRKLGWMDVCEIKLHSGCQGWLGVVIDDIADAISPGGTQYVEQLPPGAVRTATKVWEQCSESPGSK